MLKRGVNIWHNRPPKIDALQMRNKDWRNFWGAND